MRSPFPTGCYRASIENITQSVFEKLGLRVVPAFGSHMPSRGCTAVVYFAGEWSGALLLECSEWQAMSWTARLMSLPEPIHLEDARDGVGELAGILAGTLIPLLPPGIALSVPSVVQGRDYSFRVCRGNTVERLLFRDASGAFAVALAVALEVQYHVVFPCSEEAEQSAFATLAGKESGSV